MSDPVWVGSRDLEDYGRAYDALPFERVQAQVRRRLVLQRIAVHKPRTLVEVGCANEPLFTDLPDTRCVVVEPQVRFAAGATRAASGRDDVHVVQAEIEQVGDRVSAVVDRVDMVVVSGLLHEVPDPAAVVRAVRALCSPASVIHVNVPNVNSLHRHLGVAMAVSPSLQAFSQTQVRLQQAAFYDAERLRAQVESCDFRTIASGAILIKPFAAAEMQRMLEVGALTTVMIDGLDALARVMPDLASEIWLDAVLDA